MSKAYEEGRAAYGTQQVKNPYHHETTEYEDWEDGYLDAHEQRWRYNSNTKKTYRDDLL